MNNSNNRINAIYSFSSTMIFVLLGLNALTRYYLHQEPKFELKWVEVMGL